MSKSLVKFFETIKKYYPYLRNHFSSESADIIYDFFMQKPIIKKYNDRMVVELSMGYHLPRCYCLKGNRSFLLTGGKAVYSSSGVIITEQTDKKMEINLK